VRKAIAKQVYREWMPVSDDPYAAYDVGDLATLFRIDTRLEGREEQFDLVAMIRDASGPEEILEIFRALRDGPWADPERQLLGAAQEKWLVDGLAASKQRGAVWEVLIQQVLIGKLSSPKGVTNLLGDNVPEFARARLTAASLAAEVGLPLNMDAWDGYPAARNRVFEGVLAARSNLVVLAGDTHNAWHFDLTHKGEKVGVEFATSSVSSPGFEGVVSAIPPALLANALVNANDDLQWADTSQRGYMMVELTPETATSEWRFLKGIKERSTEIAETRTAFVEARG